MKKYMFKGILLVIAIFLSYWIIVILGWKVGSGIIILMVVSALIERWLDKPKD